MQQHITYVRHDIGLFLPEMIMVNPPIDKLSQHANAKVGAFCSSATEFWGKAKVTLCTAKCVVPAAHQINTYESFGPRRIRRTRRSNSWCSPFPEPSSYRLVALAAEMASWGTILSAWLPVWDRPARPFLEPCSTSAS